MEKQSEKAEKERRRYSRETIEELRFRAGWKCEFDDCNCDLYQHDLTRQEGNFGEIAHILPFSPNGPRGHEIEGENLEERNSVDNLMLLCPKCHHLIDANGTSGDYSKDKLLKMKRAHEKRIEEARNVTPEKKSHVVIYEAPIGNQTVSISTKEANYALLPERYPNTSIPHRLSTATSFDDTKSSEWKRMQKDLVTKFHNTIRLDSPDEPCKHVSIFALAPIPLLIQLGVLFCKIGHDIYHPRLRDNGWKWHSESQEELGFSITRPEQIFTDKPVVLKLCISASISNDRITQVMGQECSIWEISEPAHLQNPLSLKTKNQLKEWETRVYEVLEQIKNEHGMSTPISIFPAIPVPCAVSLGTLRLEKVHSPWIIYDHNGTKGKFIKTITIK